MALLLLAHLAGALSPLVEGESDARTLRRMIFRTHDPYANLTLRPYSASTTGGAGGRHFSKFYTKLISELSPKLVIEVGVHYGSSTVKFAQIMRQKQRGGAVLAVDTWLGATDWWGDGRAYLPTTGNYTVRRCRYDCAMQPHGVGARSVDDRRKDVLLTGSLPKAMTDLLWVNGRPSIYLSFLSNVVHAGVQDRVVPFPIPSRQAARFLAQRGIQADLIHIDGSHEYEEVVDDLRQW
jgi:hypothetical protein